MFKVSSQDFQFWTPDQRKPEVKEETFTNEQHARIRYNELKATSTNILVTIQPLVLKARGKQTGLKDRHGNKFNKTWKLHR
jgi:hypothetical protein